IEGERRFAASDVERALPKFEADRASDALLRDFEEAVERFTQRRKPEAVVDELRIAHAERLLEVGGFAVDGEALKFLMCFDEQRAARSFVSAAGFHSDETIFDEVGAADAMLGSDFVERVEQIDRPQFFAVYGNRSAGFETDFDVLSFVRRFFGRD